MQTPSQTDYDAVYQKAVALIRQEWLDKGMSEEEWEIEQERATYIDRRVAAGCTWEAAIEEADAEFDNRKPLLKAS
jgi:hypothetical protein